MNNRINLIVELIKLSSAFSCNHITYKEEGEKVVVQCTNERGVFTATELCASLQIFNTYLRVNEEGKIELIIF